MTGRAEKREAIRRQVEALYAAYHRPEWIGSDPLQFVHRYDDPRDQEIVGLIAASLAYGNVATIHRSIAEVLRRMEESPRRFLETVTERGLPAAVRGFRHRWTGEAALGGLLSGMRAVIAAEGGLGAAFAACVVDGESDYEPALGRWVERLQGGRPRLA